MSLIDYFVIDVKGTQSRENAQRTEKRVINVFQIKNNDHSYNLVSFSTSFLMFDIDLKHVVNAYAIYLQSFASSYFDIVKRWNPM